MKILKVTNAIKNIIEKGQLPNPSLNPKGSIIFGDLSPVEQKLGVPTNTSAQISIPSITTHNKESICKPWLGSFIIHLWGNLLTKHLIGLWNLKAKPRLLSLGGGFLLASFQYEEDRWRALLHGPTFIEGRFLSVRLWTARFNPQLTLEEAMSSVWIRLENLPFKFYNIEILIKIGRALGPFLGIDSDTHNLAQAKVARICVLVDLSKQVPPSILIDDYNQKIWAEGTIGFWSTCGRNDHSSSSYRSCSSLSIETENEGGMSGSLFPVGNGGKRRPTPEAQLDITTDLSGTMDQDPQYTSRTAIKPSGQTKGAQAYSQALILSMNHDNTFKDGFFKQYSSSSLLEKSTLPFADQRVEGKLLEESLACLMLDIASLKANLSEVKRAWEGSEPQQDVIKWIDPGPTLVHHPMKQGFREVRTIIISVTSWLKLEAGHLVYQIRSLALRYWVHRLQEFDDPDFSFNSSVGQNYPSPVDVGFHSPSVVLLCVTRVGGNCAKEIANSLNFPKNYVIDAMGFAGGL
ncbi:uncharacterized protein G2W53_022366 [Senna tora]|uniref:DUF4283 domain-containing protein n=1 Tax=Senna tora TaxID=362788 RepID=A0A834TMJ6_9FABA|nr:uncharacterized protein G2W53_022366 [Senna tora]